MHTNEQNLAPVCLFVYNRLWHTKKTIGSLLENALSSGSELFIFSDGPKNDNDKDAVMQLRRYLATVSGFMSVSIIEREKNMGLAKSILAGVTEVINKYGKVIVLEDDIMTSPYFLNYMNNALDYYENNDSVISIHGYTYPVKDELPETFFLRGADCWGWATWRRGWDLFEADGKKLIKELNDRNLIKRFDLDGAFKFSEMLKGQVAGLNDSWAVRWHATAFLQNKLTLYPGQSLVRNSGLDGSGTHGGGKKNVYDTNVLMRPIHVGDVPVVESEEARNAFIKFFRSNKSSLSSMINFKIKQWRKQLKKLF